ncbi:MAG: transcription antitermination factor NusB [Cytophagales bacterium]|jgi:N utilization substance protein B|nr:transcription antitermination factor NusB [Cytophagales bacterium]MCA6419976.1 transcription antitermination factor NusB [Cytophagales bacterium]MCA6434334.1 transcription antitermination factor NusB [Cytophagales bacterium]
MLNRRTIRIKIMQSLFAFEQCKEANYLLSLDLLDERFSPDLNSMEVQDKDFLRKQKKEAKQVFENQFKKATDVGQVEKAISIAVADATTLFEKQVRKDQQFLGKNITIEIQKLTETYHNTLGLIIALAEVAGGEKKSIHANFSNQPIIQALIDNPELKKELLRSAGWANKITLVRDWFREILKEDKEYQKFIESKSQELDSQKAFLKYLLRKVILGSNAINDYFEEQDIRWAEDKDIIKSLAEKTIKSFDGQKVELQKVSLDWEDDKLFIDRLFKNTIELDESYKELIAQNTKNWEVDRLPLTDRVILEMALAEMVNFPNIPVKVTINEYIELAKEYSTPKSRQFINGILDVISKKMKESGAVKKSGRGLIDNK